MISALLQIKKIILLLKLQINRIKRLFYTLNFTKLKQIIFLHTHIFQI